MRSKIIVTSAMAFLIAISFSSIAQKDHKKSKHKKETLKEIKVFKGLVGTWANNENFIYDGFYLQTSTVRILVKFPTHMGEQLTKALKTGSTITVNGAECSDSLMPKEIKFVSIISDGMTINNVPLVSKNIEPSKEFINGNGKIIELQKDNKENVNGFILDNKTILRVSPQIAKQIEKIAAVGTQISFSGMKKSLKEGEVASVSYSIIHCKTISVNGKQYLTK